MCTRIVYIRRDYEPCNKVTSRDHYRLLTKIKQNPVIENISHIERSNERGNALNEFAYKMIILEI